MRIEFPEKLNLDGDPDKIFDGLYEIFERDFITNKCFYNGLEVKFDSRKIDSDYEEGFWHIVTKQYKNEPRYPDYKRAKRIHWIRIIIENSEAENIKCFIKDEKIHLWSKENQFIVVLKPISPTRCILITAFKVYRKKEREFERYFSSIKNETTA